LGKSFTQRIERVLRVLFFWLLLATVAGACSLPEGIPGIAYQGTPTVTPLIGIPAEPAGSVTDSIQATAGTAPNADPTAMVPPTQAPLRLWIAPYLPGEITTGLVAPFPLTVVEDNTTAELVLDIGDANVITRLVYALAAPFPVLHDEVSMDDLALAWAGSPQGVFQGTHLYLSEATYVRFTRWWGPPGGDFVRVLSEDMLLENAWREGSAWALLPFEQLEPRWKVISVDGSSPIWKSFNPEYYPLSVPISVTGQDPGLAADLAEAFRLSLPSAYDRDAYRLTTVVLTGVTALVRATADEMETFGIVYPALDIGDMLREADILHISNEIPFAESCPNPNPTQPNLIFCSSPEYLLLLETIGTDVIELTGDHFGDWGTAAVLYTLDLYDQAGISYYGGGETVAEAQAPMVFEHNGNRIAFLGCNAKGGSYTPLARGNPGAVDCRYGDIIPVLNQLDVDGYVTIMTFQHYEYYYFEPNITLEEDFRMVADAGADIVSGSQAHQPHGIEFYHGSTLFYGLGNLFFDQLTVSEDTARALITRNVIYENRHISSEIITVYFSDFSRPRYLLDAGRISLLNAVFSASEWGDLGFGN
jgi:poly-gamma-glutamate synthesis protein (capsule biosynthesis protein)